MLAPFEDTDPKSSEDPAKHKALTHAYGTLLSIGSNHPSELAPLALNLMGLLPNRVSALVIKWEGGTMNNEFPSIGAWVGIL